MAQLVPVCANTNSATDDVVNAAITIIVVGTVISTIMVVDVDIIFITFNTI